MHNDIITSFEELLVKDKTFTIYHQNIQSLAIEMYKAVNNLPGGNLSEFFVRNNKNIRELSWMSHGDMRLRFLLIFRFPLIF